MSIKIESPAEAFASIASVMIAADSVGSIEERNATYAHVKDLEAFQGYDAPKFLKLLGEMTDRVFSSLPLTDTGAVAPLGVVELIGAVRKVLNADQRAAAIRVAAAISGSDAEHAAEASLLGQLRAGLAG